MTITEIGRLELLGERLLALPAVDTLHVLGGVLDDLGGGIIGGLLPRQHIDDEGLGAIRVLSAGPAAYPAVAATPSSLVAAWTETAAAGSEIRVRRLPRP